VLSLQQVPADAHGASDATSRAEVLVPRAGLDNKGAQLFAAANQTAHEGIMALRTVASYNMQASVAAIYRRMLEEPNKRSNKNALWSGMSFALSQFIMFQFYALAFWYGGRQARRGDMQFVDMLKVFFSILLASMGISQAQIAFPDVAKGKSAVARIFRGAAFGPGALYSIVSAAAFRAAVCSVACHCHGPVPPFRCAYSCLLCFASCLQINAARHQAPFRTTRYAVVVDRKTLIDASNTTGETRDGGPGAVELSHVFFAYPTRPDVPVFRDFCLSIAPGKVTALVGESGSGKSTIVSLIERFYEATRGQVLMDGADVRQLSIQWLRSRVRSWWSLRCEARAQSLHCQQAAGADLRCCADCLTACKTFHCLLDKFFDPCIIFTGASLRRH
jgi:ABC-type multidrug transport system fused ATPase/permease subunit